MTKGLAEGAEDGLRDALCKFVRTGQFGGEYQGFANLHGPEGVTRYVCCGACFGDQTGQRFC